MKLSATIPAVLDNEWYNTTDAIRHMGMERTTFWRRANAGWFKRKWRSIDGNWWYEGKGLKAAWLQFDLKRRK